jgi:hypothetical protein
MATPSSIRLLLLAAGVSALFGSASAADRPVRDEVIRNLLQRDMPELLEVYLQEAPPAKRIYAGRAWAQHAVNETDPARKQAAFAHAEAIYEACISGENVHGLDPEVRELHVVIAQVELADMIFRQQAAEDLDEFEITSGLGGDRGRLVTLLTRAVTLYQQADEKLRPLDEAVAADEEHWLILGLYDTVQETRDRLAAALPWAELYLALALPADDAQREALLADADAKFAELLAKPPPEVTADRIRLGLGMVCRARDQAGPARRYFRDAGEETKSPTVRVRAEIGLAQLDLDAGRFDQARQQLAKLIDQGRNASADDRPTFYLHLAELLHARSYLLQAEALTAAGRDPRTVSQLRATGMGLFETLTERPTPWPQLAQIYVAAHIPADAKLDQLTETELWLTGTHAMEENEFGRAREVFEVLVERSDRLRSKHSDSALYNLAVCEFQLGQLQSAGERFARYAETYRQQPLAPKASYLAYRCYSDLARQTAEPDDYRRAADAAANVLARFPDHPQHAELRRALPALYEQAGMFDQALALYRQARPGDQDYLVMRHAEALCNLRLLAAEQRRMPGSPKARELADRVARSLRDFAELAGRTEPPADLSAEMLQRWALEALVLAAEVYANDDVAEYQQALDVLAEAEDRLAALPALHGRALAVKIQAYRGLGQFDKATAAIDEFVTTARPEQVGRVLIDLVGSVESRIEDLRWQGRDEQARALAEGGVQTAVQLLHWFENRPERADQVRLVETTLAEMLVYAGRAGEAQPILESHLADDPKNGELVRLRALACEQQTVDAEPEAQQTLRRQAEQDWQQLLADGNLRQTAPKYYWEALVHWLTLRLQASRAEEVARRIEQEQIWFPSLGGEPFKQQIIRLLEQARAMVSTTRPAEPTP